MKAITFWVVLFVHLTLATYAQQTKSFKKNVAGAWVEQITPDLRAMPDQNEESSYYYILLDQQEYMPGEEFYSHHVYKILTNDGLQQMSDINLEYDPSYEEITLHTLRIHRDGKVIDRMSSNVEVLRREKSMDRSLYDGTFTALINLTDVRVGDVIEYSFTRKGYNPVYDGNFSRVLSLNYGIPVHKISQLIHTRPNTELFIKYKNSKPVHTKEAKNGIISYRWLLQKVPGLLTDSNTPGWYDPFSYAYISTISDWHNVAAWAFKHYQVSDKEKSSLAKAIEGRFNFSEKEKFITEAVRFVQDEIRYLGFESGLNSHKPHAPTQVYEQRFGDCKDKSLLLSTILRIGGIESFPMLVNSSKAKLEDQLPSINAFDHCVLQYTLDGRSYYIDPTISNQGGRYDQIYFPDYGKGLLIQPTSADLINLPPPLQSSITELQTFDISSIGGEAVLTVETTYAGSEADNQRSYFLNNSMESIQKNYIAYYGNLYPDIQKFETIQTEDNRATNIFRIKEKYKIPTFWNPLKNSENKVYCEFYPIALETYFNISKSANRTSPYRLAYPLNYSHKIVANLPEEWSISAEKSELKGDAYEYNREVSYEDRVLELNTSYKTKNEFVSLDQFQKFVDDHAAMMNTLSYQLQFDKSFASRTSSKWPGIVVNIISLVIGILISLWAYYKYDPQPRSADTKGLDIGGWLLLVAFGLCLTPFRLIYDFATNDYILSGEVWLSHWYAENYYIFAFVLGEHIYNVVYLIFSVVLVILFFQKRTSVPLLASIFYCVVGIVTLLDQAAIHYINPDQALDYQEIMRAIVTACIWAPYFQLSTRVKNTFVVVLNNARSEG